MAVWYLLKHAHLMQIVTNLTAPNLSLLTQKPTKWRSGQFGEIGVGNFRAQF